MSTETDRRDLMTSRNRLNNDADTLRSRMRALAELGRGRVEHRHEREWQALKMAADLLEREASKLWQKAQDIPDTQRPASHVGEPMMKGSSQ